MANAEPRAPEPRASSSAEEPPKHWTSAVGLTHPVYNVSVPKLEAAMEWYKAQPDVLGGSAAAPNTEEASNP